MPKSSFSARLPLYISYIFSEFLHVKKCRILSSKGVLFCHLNFKLQLIAIESDLFRKCYCNDENLSSTEYTKNKYFQYISILLKYINYCCDNLSYENVYMCSLAKIKNKYEANN